MREKRTNTQTLMVSIPLCTYYRNNNKYYRQTVIFIIIPEIHQLFIKFINYVW
jgi:hypothetical protein